MKTQPFIVFDTRLLGLLRWQRIVFGGWAAINTLMALFFLFLAAGPYWYFGLMNLTWGIVNFAVLWWLYLHTRAARFTRGGQKERDWVQRHVTLLLLLNVGLDCTYVLVGAYLLELAANSSTTKMVSLWMGFGTSLLVQGSFLLLQDLLFWWLHRRNFFGNWPDHLANLSDKNQSEA